VEDEAAVVGDADYVFVGRVDKQVNTEYKHAVKIETENGTREVARPYTNYSITVLENIKGELEKGVPNPVQKSGGLNQDGKSITLYENDHLPQIDGIYIFIAYAQKDGSLLVSGPNSNIPVKLGGNVNGKAGLSETKEYQNYVSAYKNEKSTSRPRFVSVYDTKKN